MRYISYNFTITKYHEDHTNTPIEIQDKYGDVYFFLKNSEYTDSIIEKLDRVYEAGVKRGEKQKEDDIKKLMNIS